MHTASDLVRAKRDSIAVKETIVWQKKILLAEGSVRNEGVGKGNTNPKVVKPGSG